MQFSNKEDDGMGKNKHLLSKSAYLHGLACDRFFWIYQNDRERLPAVDEQLQAIFDQGHQIGGLAKSLYPGGLEIDWGSGHEAGVAQTAALLPQRKPIFEAGFQHAKLHARADILNPSTGGKWDLIEVKSSSKVKEEHLPDVAFQRHLYERAGIRINRCFLMHVDMSYVRSGSLNANKLFACEDVTADIAPWKAEIPKEIRRQLSVMAQAKAPAPVMCPECQSGCPLYDECWSFLPEHSVFSLYSSGQKAYDLMSRNILAIEDIPADYPLTQKQSIQVACARSGKCHVQPAAIAAFLKKLQYPLYFLDFETFMMGIPPYDELSPYEPVPFQYSLHVIKSRGSRQEHFSYLSGGETDPRPEILDGLKKRLGRTGSIVAFNAAFEKRVLNLCAKHFQGFRPWIESLMPRFVDLLIPFREFHYYHPDQNGSASLKAVLPALTNRSYEGLEIADGEAASLRFMDMAFGNLSASEKAKIRKALETYCHQDTEGMIDILKALEKLC
jgi:hypothetical protein